MAKLPQEIKHRRTFGIISHPDAGKTTVTEKLLLFGGAIQMAGTVKSRKADRFARSDWMKMEQERGISVSSSAMQFPYKNYTINLLDTPGHEDFSEDTYRTLTAVDSALMVIDVAKGVEKRTIKLMAICRMRNTPIISFINKLDREGKEPIALLEEIEKILNIACVPINWPIGMGKRFRGIYNLVEDTVTLFDSTQGTKIQKKQVLAGINNENFALQFPDEHSQLQEEIELIQELTPAFNSELYLAGKQTPVYFGSAINNFGIQQLLDGFCKHAPHPKEREAKQRRVASDEKKFSGFVFKIQANMDPKHRDRIAFLRIVSGKFNKGMSLFQVRRNKEFKSSKALTFLANSREQVENAFAGDIIGLHNHGTIKIGDTFTEGETLKFIGVPNFAPELFQRAQLKDPLKMKQLQKGLHELSEEGATQLFKPMKSNDMILGAIGVLQFEVVKQRLKDEYKIEVQFEQSSVNCVRWVLGTKTEINKLIQRSSENLALDIAGNLTYLAPSKINLELTMERWAELKFVDSMEI